MSAHASVPSVSKPVDWRVYAAAVLASLALLIGGYEQTLPMPFELPQPTMVEVAAFVFGAWAVWLAAKNNVWSWPLGVINAALFVVLFYQSRLYFDSAINVFYVGSGVYGLWFWLRGGQNYTERPVFHASRRELTILAAVVAAFAVGMWQFGLFLRDAAPIGDSITTALSIGAQWLLMRRFIENWYLWIAADIIYIPLYWTQSLYLTSVLYVVFLLMCLVGVKEWRAIHARQKAGAAVGTAYHAATEA